MIAEGTNKNKDNHMLRLYEGEFKYDRTIYKVLRATEGDENGNLMREDRCGSNVKLT